MRECADPDVEHAGGRVLDVRRSSHRRTCWRDRPPRRRRCGRSSRPGRRTANTDGVARSSVASICVRAHAPRVPPLDRDEVGDAVSTGSGSTTRSSPASRLRASVLRLSEAIGRSSGIQSWRCHCDGPAHRPHLLERLERGRGGAADRPGPAGARCTGSLPDGRAGHRSRSRRGRRSRRRPGSTAHRHHGGHDAGAGTDQVLTAMAVGLHPGLHGVTLLRPLPRGLASLGVSEHRVPT